MILRRHSLSLAAIAAVGLLAFGQAQALDTGSLKDKAGSMMSGGSGSSSGAASLLGSLSSGSFNLASAQNVAGVLGYCQKNGYSPSASETVKNKLMDKLGLSGDKASKDEGYQQGLSGLLKGQDGQSFSLDNIKQQAGEKACGMIADKATSSFL